MGASGKHHQLGQSTKSVLDPSGHLLTTNGGKRYIVITVVAQQTLHTQINTKNSYIHQPLSNPECNSERELKSNIKKKSKKYFAQPFS